MRTILVTGAAGFIGFHLSRAMLDEGWRAVGLDNHNDYYDPANSYIHHVLQTRRGIPISVALIWLELAAAIDLPAQGVSFPGHFLVKMRLPQGQVVMDPTTGQSLSREDLSERLEPYKRQSALVDDYDVPLGLYLQAATPRDIIARMLRNLKEVHRSQQDWQRLTAVLDRLVVLSPQAWGERRDRGLAHAELGNAKEAVQDLETYLAHAEDGLDADMVTERLNALRRSLG